MKKWKGKRSDVSPTSQREMQEVLSPNAVETLDDHYLKAVSGGTTGILGQAIQLNRMMGGSTRYSLIGGLSYFGDPSL